MNDAAAHSGYPWSNQLVHQLADDDFRREYMMDQVRSFIAFQIRALREQPERRWLQADLAEKAGTTQSVISRAEDPDYGKLSLQSLLEIANAFDLGLLVQFVEWDDWLTRMSNLSPSALRKRGFNSDRLLAQKLRSESDFQQKSSTLPENSFGKNSPSSADNWGLFQRQPDRNPVPAL